MSGQSVPVIRVVLAEPEEVAALMLERCLADGRFAVVRGPGATAGLRDWAPQDDAGVVIIGPGFDRSGLEQAVPQLLVQGLRTLVVSETPLDEAASRLLLAGASGFLMVKDATPDSVVEAVKTVASGSTALHPDVIHAVMDQWRRSRAEVDTKEPEASPALTPRELDVLQGISDGLTSRLLAARLGVAEKTIEAHKSRLYSKLGARNQAHAVRIAADRDLLSR